MLGGWELSTLLSSLLIGCDETQKKQGFLTLTVGAHPLPKEAALLQISEMVLPKEPIHLGCITKTVKRKWVSKTKDKQVSPVNSPLEPASKTSGSFSFSIFFCFIDIHTHSQLSSPLSLSCRIGGWIVLGCSPPEF